MGEASGPFLSAFLGAPAELVYMPESSVRPVNPAYAKAGERVGFADGYPFLLIGQASLDELNRRLPHPVPIDRFRPNLVLDGLDANGEDHLDEIVFGARPDDDLA